MTINTEWLERYLKSACHKVTDGTKWTYEEIKNEELFRIYTEKCHKKDTKRPSSVLREQNIVWKVRFTCRNEAEKMNNATPIAFRDRSELAGQISKEQYVYVLRRRSIYLTPPLKLQYLHEAQTSFRGFTRLQCRY